MSTLTTTHNGHIYDIVVSNSGLRVVMDGTEVFKSWGTDFHVTSQAEFDTIGALDTGDTIHLAPGTYSATFDSSAPIHVVPDAGFSGIVTFDVG